MPVPVVVVRVAAVALGLGRVGGSWSWSGSSVIGSSLVDTTDAHELEQVLVERSVRAVVIDAARPGQLTAVVSTAGEYPVLRPIWIERRNSRGATDRVFGGYGLLVPGETHPLGDGELAAR